MKNLTIKSISTLLILCLQFSSGVAIASREQPFEDSNLHGQKRYRSEQSGAIDVIANDQNQAVDFLNTLPYGLIRKIGIFVTSEEAAQTGHKYLINYMLTCKKIKNFCRGRTLDVNDNPIFSVKNHLMFMYLRDCYVQALNKFNSFPELLHLISPHYEESEEIGAWIMDESIDEVRRGRIQDYLNNPAAVGETVVYEPLTQPSMEPRLAKYRLMEFFFWFDACCQKYAINQEDYVLLDKMIGYAFIPEEQWNNDIEINKIHWHVKNSLRNELLENIRFIPSEIRQIFNLTGSVMFTEMRGSSISFLRYVAPVFPFMPFVHTLAFDDIKVNDTNLPSCTQYCMQLSHLSLCNNRAPEIQGVTQYEPLPKWILNVREIKTLNLENSDYILPDMAFSLQDCTELFITSCEHQRFPYWLSKLKNLELLIIDTDRLLPLLDYVTTDYRIEILHDLLDEPNMGERVEIHNDHNEELSQLQRLLKDNNF